MVELWRFSVNLTRDEDSVAFCLETSRAKLNRRFSHLLEDVKRKGAELNISVTLGNGSKSIGSSKVELQEVSVLVILDSMIEGNDLDNHTTSNRFYKEVNTQESLDFLYANISWMKSCTASAETLYGKFYSNGSLDNLKFHCGDDIYGAIRSHGSNLSGIHQDKWNPSDIMFVHESIDKDIVSGYNSIEHYNEFIGRGSSVIGVSLKKSMTEALHGSYALSNIAKFIGVEIVTFGIMKEALIGIESSLISISNSNFSDIVYVQTPDNYSLRESLDHISNLNKTSKLSVNFLKSLPISVNFLSKLDRIQLYIIVERATYACMSQFPESCDHYKLQAGDICEVSSTNMFTITLKRVRIKLNGDTDVIFDININDEPYKLQLRSKGSLPQFILIRANEDSQVAINITTLISNGK